MAWKPDCDDTSGYTRPRNRPHQEMAYADLVELQTLYARPAPPVERLEGNSAEVVVPVVNALEVGRLPQYDSALDEARPSATPDDLNHRLGSWPKLFS